LAGVIMGMAFLHERRSATKPPVDLAGVITEVIGFGAILYAASIAADQGWASPATLFFFGLGAVGLVAFGVVELYVSKSPLLDLRLFGNRVFLNASLLGYVSTVALFGAEFLMPVYLQSLRGRTALQTGLILLPMAIAGGVLVTISGRLYDKVGPRPLLVTGYALLMVNTWQLALIRSDTTLAWIIFLLVLRGLALGLTVQTTIVTALSVVPRRELARGSSLTNATRLVIQSIGVAVLATVLASTLSPEVRALQDQFQGQATVSVGLCETTPALGQGSDPAASVDSRFASLPRVEAPRQAPATGVQSSGIVQQACRENIAGFERAYQLTFFLSVAALVLGLMLPGWPGKWLGRQAMPEAPVSMH
jgi:MFS family permease